MTLGKALLPRQPHHRRNVPARTQVRSFPGDDYPKCFRGAFLSEVIQKTKAKPACMGANYIVISGIIAGRPLKDGLSNGSLIKCLAFSDEALFAHMQEKCGKT